MITERIQLTAFCTNVIRFVKFLDAVSQYRKATGLVNLTLVHVLELVLALFVQFINIFAK